MEGELARFAGGFRGYERPRGFALASEDFTVESGLLTPSMKLERREAIARFGPALEALYRQARPQVFEHRARI